MNARDILFYGNRTLLESMGRVPPSERTTPGLIGWWSAREAMAHLTIFEAGLTEILESFLGGPPPHLMVGMEASKNDALVAQKQGMSFDDLLAEYNAHVERNLRLIEKIPSDKLRAVGMIPWYGDEYALDDFIVYTYYGHKREHAARFEAFGDMLENKA